MIELLILVAFCLLLATLFWTDHDDSGNHSS